MTVEVEFQARWRNPQTPPDVFKFLQKHCRADAQQWLAVLRLDQQHRWQTTAPLPVEDYLSELAELPAGVDWRLQLAIGEFEARRQTDHPLSEAEISARFPDLRETFREILPSKRHSGERVDFYATIAFKPQRREETAFAPLSAVTYITPSGIGVEQRGRYRLERILGEGTFGRVYLGFDEELQRQVAIKVPTKERFRRREDSETFLAEARTVAGLDHPHIVSVYDMGRVEDGSVYVVSRYVAGTTLEGLIKEARPTHRESAAMVATIAMALHYAHQKRLIHRDIKPANILIDGATGTPFVADFGLAVREEDFLKQPDFAGSPAYMSPEQARGEGHRLDGRSDLFSLGAILYELLTGKRPFRGNTLTETLRLVVGGTPRRPRELDNTIAPELERICLKALSKRASDRYVSCAALAEDLQEWIMPKSVVAARKQAQTITPRGLRSFTAEDAGFFLDLLPGPRNRSGLPESVAFWKQRIEQRDPDQTFSVGLLYGPSGCGKSSLVKAGLIPSLSSDVIAIYIEATPDETEIRLRQQLRNRLPELPEDLDLVEMLEWIRRSAGPKVVLIIDQFEQWVHSNSDKSAQNLQRGLRQCDGGRLQAILMIRDDFYLAAARVMNEIDVPVVTDQNFKLVDLFDIRHAQNVLLRFGQAYGKLPKKTQQLTAEQVNFIRQVVEGLSERGKVVSVRLALLAEMLKGREWSIATLESIGGLDGIGVSFLEETFVSDRADARHRQHQEAVRGVLRALLPETRTNIKGAIRSEEELLEASGYRNRPSAFQELLRILDGELRLVTPTIREGDGWRVTGEGRRVEGDGSGVEGDSSGTVSLNSKGESPGDSELSAAQPTGGIDGTAASGEAVDSNRPPQPHAQRSPQSPAPENLIPSTLHPPLTTHFQLTHDYLVPPLYDWLTCKQQETKKGRAELKLAERAATWGAIRENRQLPTIWEWLAIRFLTESAKWQPAEKAVMLKATTYHMQRLGLAGIATALLLISGFFWQREVSRRNELERIDRVVERLISSEPGQIPIIVADLASNPELADKTISQLLQQKTNTTDEKRSLLHARMAGVGRDPTLVAPLIEELLHGKLTYVEPIRKLLRPYASGQREKLEKILRDSSGDISRRFRAALALADYVPSSETEFWTDQDLQLVTRQLISSHPDYQPLLRDVLQPIKPKLLDHLGAIFSDESATAAERFLAADALADYARDDVPRLVHFLMVANVEQYRILYPLVDGRTNSAVLQPLRDIVGQQPGDDWDETQRVTLGRQRAGAAITLLKLGDRPAPLGVLKATTDMESISQFAARCKDRAVSAHSLLALWDDVEHFRRAAVGDERKVADRMLYGFLVTLGSYSVESLPRYQQQDRIEELVKLYKEDPSSGVHGATGWLLRQWGQHEAVEQIDNTPVPYDPKREWFVQRFEPTVDRAGAKLANPQPFHVTFIVFPAGQYQIGSPTHEKDRGGIEKQVLVTITRPLAIADREICWRQYSLHDSDSKRQSRSNQFNRSLALDEPSCSVNWYESVAYCRWLGQVIGLTESEQCYPDASVVEKDEEGNPRNWPLDLSRGGFRLPTMVEWEIASRGGMVTRYTFGSDRDLLGRYGWYMDNSEGWSKPVGQLLPDSRGLFDTCGNVWEWTHDWYGGDVVNDEEDPLGPEKGAYRVLHGGSWGCVSANCRSAYRHYGTPFYHAPSYGFRIALSPSGVGKTEVAPQSDSAPRPAVAPSEPVPNAPPVPNVSSQKSITNSIGMKLVSIPKGTFMMGSPAEEADRADDETPHEVTLGQDYFLGMYEVTQEQYEKLIGKNPSQFKGLNHPVEEVSWEEAVEFCKQLSDLPKEKAAGRVYRLPTEAEWEYACRAGTSTKYSCGDDELQLGEYAWIRSNSVGTTHPVGQKRANAWGLHDMHGNVFEWCADRYGKYPPQEVSDPQGDTENQIRLIRGGSWSSEAKFCRSAYRYGDSPDRRSFARGFRVAVSHSGQGPRDSPAKTPPGPDRTELTNSIGMKLVLIPKGTFMMGSPADEVGRADDETQHEVTISQDYFLGVYEVTQDQYVTVLGKNPSRFKRPINPVEQVTWDDAMEFCKRLSELPEEKNAGRVYRLPTEAEWEYACRAGSKTLFSFEENVKSLGDYAWFKENSDRRSHPVGEKMPNAWGLYDMHGNVWEWCSDWYGEYQKGAVTDPVGPVAGSFHVLRGGSWHDAAANCKSSSRLWHDPAVRGDVLNGFRVALSSPGIPPRAEPAPDE